MRRRGRPDEAGATLLESLLTIVIMGTVILTMATGLLATTVGARKTNNGQRNSLAMTSFSEAVRDLPFLPSNPGCTPAGDIAAYQAAYDALPAARRIATEGLDPQIVAIEYWSPRSFATSTTTTITAAAQWTGLCSDRSGAVKLRLRISGPDATPDGQGSLVAEVVKRQKTRQE